MTAYAALVDDQSMRERILPTVLDEPALTRDCLEEIHGGPLAERRPQISQSLALRQVGLQRLHEFQIDLLRSWRDQQATGEPAQQKPPWCGSSSPSTPSLLVCGRPDRSTARRPRVTARV